MTVAQQATPARLTFVMSAVAKPHLTPQEYYEIERLADHKSDYIPGGFAVTRSSSTRHSLINMNLLGELRRALKGKPCAPYTSDQRLKVKATGLRTYPDASVYCGKLAYDDEDRQSETAINPTAVFEVLSPSTEAYDRGAKASHYRKIESLRAYVLVSQEQPQVEMYFIEEGKGWQFVEVAGLDGVLSIPALSLDLSLAEIYDRVSWEPEEAV